MHDHLGEQKAQPGDWLLGTERGKIRVMSAKQFEAEFKPYAETDSSPAKKSTLDDRLSELTAEIAFLDLARENLRAELKDARAEIASLQKQIADNTEVLREHPLRKSETPAKEAWQQSHAKTTAKKRTKRT